MNVLDLTPYYFLAVLTVAGGVGMWKYLSYLYHKNDDEEDQ